jgi:hypothetical protein
VTIIREKKKKEAGVGVCVVEPLICGYRLILLLQFFGVAEVFYLLRQVPTILWRRFCLVFQQFFNLVFVSPACSVWLLQVSANLGALAIS